MGEPRAGDIVDGYRLEAILARGAMSIVFRVRSLADGQEHALKLPRGRFVDDAVLAERFRREEQTCLRLRLPGVVKAYPVPRRSRPYLLLELIGGELLRDRLRRAGRLPIDEARGIAISIAEVLDGLHRESVVHRDLKPEHVFLLAQGGVKLIDFGLAFDRRLGELTDPRLSGELGTPEYLAPERLRGLRGDARADLYSLGCILYEMLTGRLPFGGDGAPPLDEKATRDPPRPRRLRPEIPPAIEHATLAALAREPHARPESAFELREMLAHPESLVVREDGLREPRLPAAVRVLAGTAGLAALWAAFWWLGRSLGR
jgi:serine/threonine-protein kinase